MNLKFTIFQKYNFQKQFRRFNRNEFLHQTCKRHTSTAQISRENLSPQTFYRNVNSSPTQEKNVIFYSAKVVAIDFLPVLA